MNDNKTIAEIKQEAIKRYYPDKLPTYLDYKAGDRVKVIVPMEDFCPFNETDTGKIISSVEGYLGILGIKVQLDKPSAHDISIFNFKPESLYKIEEKPVKKPNTFLIESIAWLDKKGNIVGLKIPKIKFKAPKSNVTYTLFRFMVKIELDKEEIIDFLSDKIKFEE